MGIIKKKDILAIMVGPAVVCQECATDAEWEQIGQIKGGADIILTSTYDDDEFLVFCDRCGKRLDLTEE